MAAVEVAEHKVASAIVGTVVDEVITDIAGTASIAAAVVVAAAVAAAVAVVAAVAIVTIVAVTIIGHVGHIGRVAGLLSIVAEFVLPGHPSDTDIEARKTVAGA